ncbi:hypothetical protein BpHYR1_031134 [Brachionus plicatilis]|uniref:Uncharacterized protein n=1 Tax=Brachionus plicatilis TaxID=10195 RepID=A0A3M7SIX9_BRAPC|nr:hypothetical protein BpHYR1_031134 [Brachionus plicatilis]
MRMLRFFYDGQNPELKFAAKFIYFNQNHLKCLIFYAQITTRFYNSVSANSDDVHEQTDKT